MRKPLRNIGASIRARLLNLAKERNQPFDLLLTRYVLERLLYRLSLTRYREQFVLKGAILMTTWFDDPPCAGCRRNAPRDSTGCPT